MQLKQLRLLGFKTFADKTEIDIDSGMTAIVGPNGSGKSNIVDALLWVLGEQNPRLLRGASSQDVIFAGSDKRKQLGLAEVRLTIDNSDRALPIEFNEVTIARRLYRSGESQYKLNNTNCRLKDIVELFLDTGMGKGAYSFVSQSEIDAVLSAKPEDRRELFEEAAGINKYRVKKRDALRKLENAEANLSRVNDILHELDGMRGPMERQALAAKRYLLLQERLHAIEVGLLVAELQKADYELYAARKERDEEGASLQSKDIELARLEIESKEIGDVLAATEIQLEEARATSDAAKTEFERAQNRLALLTERSAGAARSRDQLGIDLREINERISVLSDSIEFDRAEREEIDQVETSRREEWVGEKAALEELERAVAQAVVEAEQRQAGRLRLAQERATREAAVISVRDRLSDVRLRMERLSEDHGKLNDALSDSRLSVENTRQDRHAIQAVLEDLQKSAAEAEAMHQKHGQELASTRNSLDSSRRKQAEENGRLNTLTELQESHEGFYQGVRAVLNAHKREEISGHFEAVVDLLNVPESYRVAIEVALGGALQDIVTKTEAEAKSGIEWLKKNRAGRATFLPIPLLRPSARTEIGRNFTEAVENASDIVSYASEYSAVIQLLLGRVLVVDDMDSAISVSRKMSGWSKIVTRDGELLTPGGALTGGSLQGKGAHLVGRKGEMDDLRKALPKTRTEVERLTNQIESITNSLAEADKERTRISSERASGEAKRAALDSSLGSGERELERLDREFNERGNQLSQLSSQAVFLDEEAARLSVALESGQIENELADSALAALSQETQELISKRDACRSRTVGFEVEVSRLREKRDGLTRAIASDRASLASLEQQLEQKTRQRNMSDSESGEAAKEGANLKASLNDLSKRCEAAIRNLDVFRTKRQDEVTRSAEAGAKIKDLHNLRELLSENLHEAEVRIARLEIQTTQSAERLMDEYGITKDEALARPEDAGIDKNTAMEVGRLRREVRGMGQVNLGAVEEYDRLTERFDFLTTQKADLDEGRESLLKTIAEIDDSTRGVFMETFEAVKTEFQKLFTRLFEGGSTELVLTKPDDLLETGIDVIAQPPGKKPQHLSLLSGGERALTATALLFAFLAVRPSPFVILDEVDAPLDGANVEKFTALVKDFSVRSQFLLITHNPVTMEAAPTWYGVTMKEAGVSSILSYRVPQESNPTEADSAVVLSSL